MTDPLERPVWSALKTAQAGLARHHNKTARFLPDIGPLCGTEARALDDLAPLITPGETLILLEEPAFLPPRGLVIEGQRACVQMVLERLPESTPLPPGVVGLTPDDADDMLPLATLTEPGPFREGTWRLGGFIGLREAGRLIAMAGERLRPAGYCEVSGICTHPQARGRGLARALTIAKLHEICARGETPFLHAYADNAGAIALYHQLGFVTRRTLDATRLAIRFTE